MIKNQLKSIFYKYSSFKNYTILTKTYAKLPKTTLLRFRKVKITTKLENPVVFEQNIFK